MAVFLTACLDPAGAGRLDGPSPACDMITAMFRAVLIWTACLALALLGIAGTHAHRSNEQNHAAMTHADFMSGAHSHAVVALFASIDGEHLHAHQDHGDVDVDPPAKAFGKLPLLKSFVAILVAFGALSLLAPLQAKLAPVLPPLRPPKSPSRPYLFPPSQAPPRTA